MQTSIATTFTPPTVGDLVCFVYDEDVRQIVRDLLAAREELPKVEARVAEILAPVFEKFEFWSRPCRSKPTSERITDERKLYLVSSEDFDGPQMKAWDQARHDALVAAGYDLPGFGYCPALIAKSRVTDLENALLDAASRILHASFGDVPYDKRDAALNLLVDSVRNLGPRQA